MAHTPWIIVLAFVASVATQQQCYYGAGAEFRGPDNLVPCQSSGTPACCLLGDVCLSGNACWDDTTGDTYQYGCTDITYQDASCPFKCGWDPTLSPWTALEYCDDLSGVSDTWTCQSPESCGCEWNSTWDLLVLAPRSCASMGRDARAALFAPDAIAPYASLPSTVGGSTGYFSPVVTDGTTTWASTVEDGYTPKSVGPLVTYSATPTGVTLLDADRTPGPATYPEAVPYGVTASTPTAPVSTPSITPVISTKSSTTTRSSSSTTPSTTAPSLSSTTSVASSGSSPNPSGTAVRTTVTTTAMSSMSMPATHTASPGGLSSAAKIGIGVGAGIGAGILLATVALFFLLSRRRHRAPTDATSQDAVLQDDEKAACVRHTEHGDWGYDPAAAYVGSAAVVHEAPAERPVGAEMPSTARLPPMAELASHIFELDADSAPEKKVSDDGVDGSGSDANVDTRRDVDA